MYLLGTEKLHSVTKVRLLDGSEDLILSHTKGMSKRDKQHNEYGYSQQRLSLHLQSNRKSQ